MEQKMKDRMDRLYALAREDPMYRIWNESHERQKEAYERFYGNQPEKVQCILEGYVGCGFVVIQRLVALACEYMIFPDEK